MKAMILAAGRGVRLRPLTDTTPKPLIQIGDIPLIAYHLINLAKIGIIDVVINISYLAEQIKSALGNGQQYGVNIHYSYEPDVLETGGGVYQALPLLSAGPFLLISADIWTDYPLARLFTKLTKLAHLVLVPNPTFHPAGDFSCENNRLSLDTGEKFTYGNIGIYQPDFFAECKPGHFRLVDVIIAQIKKQTITGEIYQGDWENVGTIEQLTALRQKIAVRKK